MDLQWTLTFKQKAGVPRAIQLETKPNFKVVLWLWIQWNVWLKKKNWAVTMKNSASFGYRFHQQECKEAHSTPPTFRRHVRWLKINQQTPSAPPHIKASRETWWTNQTQFAPTLLKASWWGEMPADIMAEDLREQSQVLLYTSWCRLHNKKGEMHSAVVLVAGQQGGLGCLAEA